MTYAVDANLSNISRFSNMTGVYSGNYRKVPFVFSVVLAIVGIIGNSHALIINVQRVRSKKKRREAEKPYIIFLLSLTIHDMFSSTILLPMEAVDTAHTFTPYSDGVCKLFRYLQFVIHISGALHITLISIHCWRQVCFPHSCQINKKYAKFFCIIFNCIAAATAVLVVFCSGRVNLTIDGVIYTLCLFGETNEHTRFLRIVIYILSTGFLVCLIIICICYVALVVNKWQSRKSEFNSSISNEEKILKKLIAILIIITILFVVAYIPFLVLGFMKVLDKEIENNLRGASAVAHAIFFRFPFLNNVVNPFVYGLLDRKFRRLFLNLYPCLKNIKKQEIEMSSNISRE